MDEERLPENAHLGTLGEGFRPSGHEKITLAEMFRKPRVFIEPRDGGEAEKRVFLCDFRDKVGPTRAFADCLGHFAPESVCFLRRAGEGLREGRVREVFDAVDGLHEARGHLVNESGERLGREIALPRESLGLQCGLGVRFLGVILRHDARVLEITLAGGLFEGSNDITGLTRVLNRATARF